MPQARSDHRTLPLLSVNPLTTAQIDVEAVTVATGSASKGATAKKLERLKKKIEEHIKNGGSTPAPTDAESSTAAAKPKKKAATKKDAPAKAVTAKKPAVKKPAARKRKIEEIEEERDMEDEEVKDEVDKGEEDD
jgi:Ulp1 family protease